MSGDGEAFVAFDTSKEKNAVAIAVGDRTGEVRYLGEIGNTPEATRKLVTKLAAKYGRLHFCYEAGPTGYGLHRQIGARSSLHGGGTIADPSARPGEDQSPDAVRWLSCCGGSAGRGLGSGSMPRRSRPHRAREAAEDLRRKRQLVTAFLLRHGRSFPGSPPGAVGTRWLAS
jgi:hypothetical protein